LAELSDFLPFGTFELLVGGEGKLAGHSVKAKSLHGFPRDLHLLHECNLVKIGASNSVSGGNILASFLKSTSP
jgi:hypothetical protein